MTGADGAMPVAGSAIDSNGVAASTHPQADGPDVSRGWIARFGLMYFGHHISWAAPSSIMLAVQVLAFYPHDKERMLAWLMGIGGLVGAVTGPLAGRLSDRTGGRFGRRLPWIVGGTLVAALALVLAGFAGSFAVLMFAWLVFQFAVAVSQTNVQSVPPDSVPAHQYGLVSGVMGLTYTLAVVAGSAVGAALGVLPAYLLTAALTVGLLLPFAMRYREPPTQPVERSSGFNLPSWRDAADFWWVFLARLLVTMAQAIALFYLLYFLRDQIKYAHPETGVLVLSATYAVFVIVTAVWSGRASDRSGKRRPFVSLSSCGVAVACIVMAFATSFTVVMVAAALLGLSWGVFQAIDMALINHVLPSEDDRAAHIGIINLAVSVPNTAAPAIAALLVTHFGGYPGLYSVAAVLTIAGGLLVWKVKSVP